MYASFKVIKTLIEVYCMVISILKVDPQEKITDLLISFPSPVPLSLIILKVMKH